MPMNDADRKKFESDIDTVVQKLRAEIKAAVKALNDAINEDDPFLDKITLLKRVELLTHQLDDLLKIDMAAIDSTDTVKGLIGTFEGVKNDLKRYKEAIEKESKNIVMVTQVLKMLTTVVGKLAAFA